MELKEIRKIVELMNEHGLSHFHLEMEDFNLKLKKGTDLEELQNLLRQMPAAAPAAAPGPVSPVQSPTAEVAPLGEEITSPMVGTYYEKPAPDAAVFVKPGDTVQEGQTLCIIEAMKVMNEIKAEKSGTIAEVCVEDAAPVQFGDTLFRLK